MDLKKDISVREIISRICFADRKKLLIFLYIGSLIVNLLYFAYSKEPWFMGNPGEDFDSYFFINAGKCCFLILRDLRISTEACLITGYILSLWDFI